MKTLKHSQFNTEICIKELTSNSLKGHFFTDKPEVGDLLMSHANRETNFYYVYEIKEIVLNRDSKVSECKKDFKNSYFELVIENVTSDERFVDFDNSINGNKL